MSALNRYIGISAVLLGMSIAPSLCLARFYGRAAASRFSRSMMATLVAQQAVVGLVVARSCKNGRAGGRHQLDLVDLMTLSRGWAAALLAGLIGSGVRDRRGVAGWMGWLALLYGAILCDWLDGPIARRRGPSAVGALLDRETDSWLTLCAAGAAVRWGRLPLVTASAPILRYGLMVEALQTTPYADLYTDEPRWVRHLGIAQMLLFIAALAPFRGRITSRLIGLTTPLQTPLQLGGVFVLRRKMLRS